MAIGAEEAYPRSDVAGGEILYYGLNGPLMRQPEGLTVIHDQLEEAGVGVYDGVIDTVPDDSDSQKPRGEIAVLRPLAETETGLLHGLGATVIALRPDTSFLHRQYLRHLEQSGDQGPKEAA